MIIERKQFGCVQMLLVQVGLALYVIVVFLAQSADGTISPKILKVQKVAEAQTEKVLLAHAKTLALESATNSSPVTTSTSELDSQIVALLTAPRDPEISDLTLPTYIHVIYDVTPPPHNTIYTIGSKPRAPTFA